MKKLLYLFLLIGAVGFQSCSSDDDADNGENTILGTWALVEVNPNLAFPDQCPDNPTITFNANNTTDSVYYDPEVDCTAESSQGNWQLVSGNTYSITIPEFGPTEGVVNFQGSNTFTFTTNYALENQEFQVTLTFEKI